MLKKKIRKRANEYFYLEFLELFLQEKGTSAILRFLVAF